jgi:hypothetical protein
MHTNLINYEKDFFPKIKKLIEEHNFELSISIFHSVLYHWAKVRWKKRGSKGKKGRRSGMKKKTRGMEG